MRLPLFVLPFLVACGTSMELAPDTASSVPDLTEPSTPAEPADPTPDPVAESPTPSPSGAEVVEETVSWDGLDHFIRIAGSGDEVLLVINGGPGQSHDYCESAEVLASDTRRVVTYDQRGTGRTAHPADGDYSFRAYARDIEAIRRHLGVETIHLLGHSHGGILAMSYTAAFPERVASLQLFASSPVTWFDTTAEEFEARLEAYEDDGTFPEGYNEIENSNDCAPYFQTIWPVYLYDASFPLTAGLRATTCDLETFFATSNNNVFDWDLSPEMAAFEGPVAVWWGEADPFIAESLTIPPAFERAALQVTEIEACGHYWEECADTFFGLSEAFLGDLVR